MLGRKSAWHSPNPPQDFVGRTDALEILYAALAMDPGGMLLLGEPGCGKSTLRAQVRLANAECLRRGRVLILRPGYL